MSIGLFDPEKHGPRKVPIIAPVVGWICERIGGPSEERRIREAFAFLETDFALTRIRGLPESAMWTGVSWVLPWRLRISVGRDIREELLQVQFIRPCSAESPQINRWLGEPFVEDFDLEEYLRQYHPELGASYSPVYEKGRFREKIEEAAALLKEHGAPLITGQPIDLSCIRRVARARTEREWAEFQARLSPEVRTRVHLVDPGEPPPGAGSRGPDS